MYPIRKRILTDESLQPIAVQVDYKDWLEIERRLGMDGSPVNTPDLRKHVGKLRLSMDPTSFQRQIRSEWR